MNIPNPTYDKPGFCSKCHEQVAEFDGERITRILSNIRSMYLRLDDGSMMQVTLCAKCKDSFTEADVPVILDSIYKGWVVETEKSVLSGNWTKEKRDNYLKEYGNKYVTEVPEKGFDQKKLIKALGVDVALSGAVKEEKVDVIVEKEEVLPVEDISSGSDN